MAPPRTEPSSARTNTPSTQKAPQVAPETQVTAPEPPQLAAAQNGPVTSPRRDRFEATASAQGFGVRYATEGFTLQGSLATAGETTQLDLAARGELAWGQVEGAARVYSGGTLGGTFLARLSLSSLPPSPNAPISGWWRAGLGYAALPDLRGSLNPGVDGLGRRTDGVDWSLRGPVLMAGGGVQGRSELAPGVSLEAGAQAELNVFVPIDTDPAVTETTQAGNNGGFPVDGAAMVMLSNYEVVTHLGLEVDLPDQGRFGVRLDTKNAMDPFPYLQDAGTFLDRYLFANKTLSMEVGSGDGRVALGASLPLSSVEGAAPSLTLSGQLDPVSFRLSATFGEQLGLSGRVAAALSEELTLNAAVETTIEGPTTVSLGLSFGAGPAGEPLAAPSVTPSPARLEARIAPELHSGDELAPEVKGLAYEELRRVVDTPEEVAALLDVGHPNSLGYEFRGLAQQVEAWDVETTLDYQSGVCVNLHVLGAALLQPQYDAEVMMFHARGVPHAVTAYRDEGGWNILQYSEIYRTAAATPEAALLQVFGDVGRVDRVDPTSLEMRSTWLPWAKAVSDFFEAGAVQPTR